MHSGVGCIVGKSDDSSVGEKEGSTVGPALGAKLGFLELVEGDGFVSSSRYNEFTNAEDDESDDGSLSSLDDGSLSSSRYKEFTSIPWDLTKSFRRLFFDPPLLW